MNFYLLLYPLIGMIAGTASGLLGIGGGMIVVPGLALAFTLSGMPHEIIMHLAAGTSLAVMIVTAAASIFAYNRLKNVLWPVVFRLMPSIIVGVVVGAVLASHLSTRWLKIFLGVALLFIAIKMFFLAEPKPTRVLPGNFLRSIIGFFIGWKSGLLGLGGGAIIIPLLTYCNVPMRKASGTSIACTLPISIVGTLSFMMMGWQINPIPLSTGYIYWPAFLGVSIMTIIFAPVGVALNSKMNVNWLKRLFAVFLCLISLGLLF